MKLNARSLPLSLNSCLAGLLLAVTPLRAADDMMAQSNPVVEIQPLHYLAKGKPVAATLLAPPPLPGSAEQEADLAEVRAVYHNATSNDMAAAYSGKEIHRLQLHTRCWRLLSIQQPAQDCGVL